MLLDKKNAGVVVKIVALLVAGAFISMYALYLVQGPSTQQPTTPGTPTTQNPQVDARAGELKAKLARDPKNIAIASELGDLYWDAGGTNAQSGDATTAAGYFQLATGAYGTVLKARPKDTNVRTDMATAFFYSGNPTRAIKELQTVLTIDPKHSNALFNLGLISKQIGDTKTAKSAWQRYLVVDPKGDNATKVQQELSQLK